jgi:uridine kinase
VDSSQFSTTDLLLDFLKKTQGDIIIYGPEIFLTEELRSQFTIKVFLELDPDLCFSKYISSNSTITAITAMNLYESQIKALNDQIRGTAQFADLILPQTKPNDKLINLLINKQERIFCKF